MQTTAQILAANPLSAAGVVLSSAAPANSENTNAVSIRPLRRVTVKILAGAKYDLSAVGNYINFLSAYLETEDTPAIGVVCSTDQGSTVLFDQPGAEFRFASDFTRLSFENNSVDKNGTARAVTVVLVIGFGAYTPSGGITRVSPQVFNFRSPMLTRPAGALVYAAGQNVTGSQYDLTSLVRAYRQGIIITKAKLYKTSNVTANAAFRLFLSRASFAPITDGVAMPIDSALCDETLGIIDFPAFIADTTGANPYALCLVDGLNIHVTGTAVSAIMRGALMALGAYSAGAGEAFYLQLSGYQMA